MMFNTIITSFVLAVATIGHAAPVQVGEMTFYDPNTGNQVACGGSYTSNDRIAALGPGSFDGRNVCGKTTTISHNGKSVTAIIRDRCKACKDGDIEVTSPVFLDFAPLSVGRLPGVSWELSSACDHSAKASGRIVTWQSLGHSGR